MEGMQRWDIDAYRRLPDCLPAQVEGLAEGAILRLAILHHIENRDGLGRAIVFSADYRHERFEYRSPGDRDAWAYGTVRLEDTDDFEPARIAFSQYHGLATLLGPAISGKVKIGSPIALMETATSISATYENEPPNNPNRPLGSLVRRLIGNFKAFAR